MRVILGGRLETALIRFFDEKVRPDRNGTDHEYYVFLNRKLPRAYFERCATFVSLANETSVPEVDWALDVNSEGRLGKALGLDLIEEGDNEWDPDPELLVRYILGSDCLSAQSRASLEYIDFQQFTKPEIRQRVKENISQYRGGVTRHFLCRLFLQIKSAHATGAFLVLAEDDLLIVREIAEFLKQNSVATPFDFPDLTGQTFDADNFASGLLNFSPPDIEAVAAVRADKQVHAYALRVRAVIGAAHTAEGEHELIKAMKIADEALRNSQRVERIFEIGSWLVKPLHYVPGIPEALGMIEDAKDVVGAWVDREADDKKWHFVGARMTEIAIQDYLRRKGNL